MRVNSIFTSLAILLATAMMAQSAFAQGISLRGIGSVNESMAGAGTAAPIGAAGAIHWNPASISDFQCNQAEMGIGMVYPDSRVESSVGPFAGDSRSESGVSPLPTMALVMKTHNPRVTMGLGVFAIAGFKLNYDASTANPIHMPQGSLGALPTFGRVNTEAQFFQIVPTLAYAINDSWSVGFAPTLTIGQLGIQPLLPGAVGPAGYSNGSGTRFHLVAAANSESTTSQTKFSLLDSLLSRNSTSKNFALRARTTRRVHQLKRWPTSSTL